MKVSTEAGETGKDTLIIEVGGKRCTVYSRHDPERDGMRFFSEHHTRKIELYLFIGLGLGYHIAPFVQNPAVKRVVILEPDEALFGAVREVESVRALCTDDKVEVYTGSRVAGFLAGLKGRYDYLFLEGFKVLTHPRLMRIFEEEHGELESRIRHGLSLLLGDALTIGSFARIWINNLFRNLSAPGEVSLVSDLFGLYRGTAVVAGAGPSLDLLLGQIEGVREEIFLIAADAALKPLMRRGVTPDLVVSVDPQPAVHYHLSDLPSDGICDIPLVMNPLCNPELALTFRTRYLYFTPHPSTELFRPLAKEVGELVFSSRAVSSLAVNLASRMGFRTICLAGMDFSYPGLRAYARHSFFHDYCGLHGTRLRTFDTEELELLRSRGSRNFEEYRREMESQVEGTVRERGAVVLNLSPLGADIEGAPRARSVPPGDRPGAGAEPNRQAFTPDPALTLCSKERRARLAETLMLRNRIYRNASSQEDARRQAEAWIVKKCGRMGSSFKV
jgi:hypothetical protein